MAIIMFGSEYIVEVADEDKKAIAHSIHSESLALLGDYCIEEHMRQLAKNTRMLRLYRIMTTVEMIDLSEEEGEDAS